MRYPGGPFLLGTVPGLWVPQHRRRRTGQSARSTSVHLNFYYPGKLRQPNDAWFQQDGRSKSHLAWDYGSRSKSIPRAPRVSAAASSDSSAKASGDRRSKYAAVSRSRRSRFSAERSLSTIKSMASETLCASPLATNSSRKASVSGAMVVEIFWRLGRTEALVATM